MSHMVTSGDGLLSAAATVRGVAAKHALDANNGRRLAPEVVDAIADAGFLRHFVPKDLGGVAGTFTEIVAATSTVAEGCASAAWVASVSATVGRMAAFLPTQGRQEVWANGPDTLVVGALMPFGRATAADGGWWLSGDWPYISGIDFSDWALVCGQVATEDGGRPELRYFAVPRASFSVLDTWFNTGMRGTGSNTLVLENVFVPAYRSVARASVIAGQGADLPETCYAAPLSSVNGLPFGACVLGAVRGMLASWSTSMSQKINSGAADGRPPVSRASFDEPLARSAGEIDIAELLLSRVAAVADRGGLDRLDTTRSSRDCALGVRYLVDTANRLFGLSGSGAHADNSPVGRAWRDAHAGASHLALRFDAAATAYADEVLRVAKGGSDA